MKTRIIYTKFWNDNYISNLNHREKLAFLYFITNEKVTICGIYELPDKYIKMDLNLTQKELDRIKQKFAKDNKFVFIDGWIKIVNFELYNNFTGNLNEKAKEKELALIPEKIKGYQRGIDTGIDRVSSNLDTLNNHKSIINNHNKGVVKGEKSEEKSEEEKIKYADFVLMTEKEHQKLIDKYGEDNTKRFIEKLNIWKGANGKTKAKGSDYLKILNWVVEAVLNKGGGGNVNTGGNTRRFENERQYSDEEHRKIAENFYA